MARTTRRREPGEVVNINKSSKKKSRRDNRKNTKQRIKEIDYDNPDHEEFDDDDHNVSRGFN